MPTITCINVLIWGALVCLGGGLMGDVAARHILGYPSHGQMVYYLYFPIGMLVVALVAFAVARIWNLKYFALVMEIIVLLAVLPYMLPYTGGV